MKTIFALVVLFSSIAFAGGIKIGKYAGEFMAIGVGGRALGMGSAYVALANDVTAGYWNPAGLARITYPEISLMHDERFGNLVNYDYAAVALPYGANRTMSGPDSQSSTDYSAASLGLSIIRLGVDGIPDTRKTWTDSSGNGLYDEQMRPDYSQITYFNAADWALYLTYAKQYSENIYYGANLKLIRRTIGGYNGTGLGFDLGALYMPIQNVLLGANLQDATTTLVAWNTGTNELISPTLKLGGAVSFEILSGRLTPAVGIDVRSENRRFSSQAHLGPISFDPEAGIEFDYKNVVALRAGYNDVKMLTLGAGIHLRKLDIDYSFAKFDADDQLGNTHRISLRVIIQEDKYRRGAE